MAYMRTKQPISEIGMVTAGTSGRGTSAGTANDQHHQAQSFEQPFSTW